MLKLLTILTLGLLCGRAVQAHGDEHKDHAHAAPATVIETASAVPTLRVESEQFELVARLYEDELGLYIDHWASNAPLLNARVEVELNGRKALAKFHADHGDYALADPALLKALQQPGEHALIFSIVDAQEADLLTGTLHVEALAATAAGGGFRWWLVASGIALLIAGALGFRLLNARKEKLA